MNITLFCDLINNLLLIQNLIFICRILGSYANLLNRLSQIHKNRNNDRNSAVNFFDIWNVNVKKEHRFLIHLVIAKNEILTNKSRLVVALTVLTLYILLVNLPLPYPVLTVIYLQIYYGRNADLKYTFRFNFMPAA